MSLPLRARREHRDASATFGHPSRLRGRPSVLRSKYHGEQSFDSSLIMPLSCSRGCDCAQPGREDTVAVLCERGRALRTATPAFHTRPIVAQHAARSQQCAHAGDAEREARHAPCFARPWAVDSSAAALCPQSARARRRPGSTAGATRTRAQTLQLLAGPRFAGFWHPPRRRSHVREKWPGRASRARRTARR